MRRRLSQRDRVAMFYAANGMCCLCGGKISAGQAWELHHVIELEMGGADDASNLAPAHDKCHRAHTSTYSVPAIAKAKRREARHLGVKRQSSFRGWRRFNGEIVRRDRSQ